MTQPEPAWITRRRFVLLGVAALLAACERQIRGGSASTSPSPTADATSSSTSSTTSSTAPPITTADTPAPKTPAALDRPSAFGWPDATNTGYRGNLGDLEPIGRLEVNDANIEVDNVVVATRPGAGSTTWGPVTLYPDRTVIDHADLEGRIKINTSIGDTEFYDSRLRAWADWETGHLIDTRDQDLSVRTKVFDCTLDGRLARANAWGHGLEFYRCNVQGGEDSFDMWWNWIVEDCYVHDMSRLPDSHNDNFQVGGAGNSVVRHSTLLCARKVADDGSEGGIMFEDGRYDPMNAVLMIGNYGGHVDGVTVEDCLVDGGNYTFNDNWRDNGNTVRNVIVRNNRFGRHFRFGPRSLHSHPDGSFPWIWEDNVWDDTGESV